jgi:hypothetical protein
MILSHNILFSFYHFTIRRAHVTGHNILLENL